MKRLLIAAAVVLFVTPLVGEDSPLVAAAKKTNRDKKKSTIVITDETLKNSTGGHVTTTKIVYAPPPVLPKAFVPEGAKVYKPAPKKTEAPKPQRPPMDDAEGYLEEDEMPPVEATSTAAPETPKAAPTPQAKKP
jgi:hypothetical protein